MLSVLETLSSEQVGREVNSVCVHRVPSTAQQVLVFWPNKSEIIHFKEREVHRTRFHCQKIFIKNGWLLRLSKFKYDGCGVSHEKFLTFTKQAAMAGSPISLTGRDIDLEDDTAAIVRDPHQALLDTVWNPISEEGTTTVGIIQDPHLELSNLVQDPHPELLDSIQDPHSLVEEGTDFGRSNSLHYNN